MDHTGCLGQGGKVVVRDQVEGDHVYPGLGQVATQAVLGESGDRVDDVTRTSCGIQSGPGQFRQRGAHFAPGPQHDQVPRPAPEVRDEFRARAGQEPLQGRLVRDFVRYGVCGHCSSSDSGACASLLDMTLRHEVRHEEWQQRHRRAREGDVQRHGLLLE